MKSLLKKELWMAWKYCRLFVLVILLFCTCGFLANQSVAVTIGGVYAAIIPFTLHSYDERQGWLLYAKTLPYTDAQIVSVKYLLNLLLVAAIGLPLALGEIFISIALKNPFALSRLLEDWLMMCVTSMAAFALMMPFCFKLGVEKGRMIYLLVVAIIFSGSFGFVGLANAIEPVGQLPAQGASLPAMVGTAAVLALLYGGSWLLSIRFYKKREL